MFTFLEFENFPAWIYHVVVAAFFYLSSDFSLPVTIVELLPLFNIIIKFNNFPFPIQVFNYRFKIYE